MKQLKAGAKQGFRVSLAKFGGAVVMDVLRTHPIVIIGGIAQENPFFVPP